MIRTILILLVVGVLVVVGVFGYRAYEARRVETAAQMIEQEQEQELAKLQNERDASLVRAPEIIRETTVVTVVLTPEPIETVEAIPVIETRVYSYTPGGLNYAWPDTGAVEWFEDEWHRIRQAANGEYLPWTFLVRISADMPLDNVAQWDSATKLLLTNPATQTMHIRVEIRRDFEVPVAYDQANPGTLGLGWFITGSRATVVIGNAETVELVGLGVKQMSFPREWKEIWQIDLELQPGAQITLNQGARRTSVDNWPLPLSLPTTSTP